VSPVVNLGRRSRLWIDRNGVALAVRGRSYQWWRPGARVPFSVRQTPERWYGRIIVRINR
jgi:hypothetical protein